MRASTTLPPWLRPLSPSVPARPPADLREVVFFGGGTGGHLLPGVAVAERLRMRHPGCRLTLFRTQRPVESAVTRGARFHVRSLDLPAPGAHVWSKVRFGRRCLDALSEVRRYLAATGVDVAVALGGYPTIPGILACQAERVPLLFLEQNAQPGRVNRFLCPLADAVACPEQITLDNYGFWRYLTGLCATGNPLRQSVLDARRWRQGMSAEERRAHTGGSARRTLLVVGGSQGARAINDFVVEHLLGRSEFRELRERIFCVHLTGAADKESVEACYRRAGWAARVAAYESQLPWLMAGADLVIARAGGGSVAELSALGVPSVLVPYPAHGDQHQRWNAVLLERSGGARVLEQRSLGPRAMESCLDLLFRDDALEAMGRSALGCARLDGADKVIDLLERLAAGHGR